LSSLVIGIDPGTARTGYGFVRQSANGSLEAVDFGVIETASDLQLPVRLLEISTALKVLLDRYRPDSGAVEKLFVREHVTTALSVGQASGVALLTLAHEGLTVHQYAPVEVKQAICGYGKAEKVQVQEMVKALLGLEKRPRPDDAADALAVAICHLHSSALERRLKESG
jgi:crossover junction endodeoxyribonuclease RuvC